MVDVPYICPHCQAMSYNPNDWREQYCGRCNRYGNDRLPLILLAEIERLDELARVRRSIVILTAHERDLVVGQERSAVRVFAE